MALTTVRLPGRSTTFVLSGDQRVPSLAMPVCVKLPSENRVYLFNMGDQPELRDQGQTLTGTPSVSSSPSGPTIGTPSVSGNNVVCRISAGTDLNDYVLTVTCGTSDGTTIIGGTVLLKVRSQP